MNISQSKLAFVVIFLISFVYISPTLFGKIDTPLDIRNIQMYPWRYYSVDKDAKKSFMWNVKFNNDKSNLEVKTPPLRTSVIQIQSLFNNQILQDIKNLNNKSFYLSFDFELKNSDNKKFLELDLTLLNKYEDKKYNPRISISPNLINRNSYFVYSSLYTFLQKIDSLQHLADYVMYLTITNKSDVNVIHLVLSNFKVIYNDLSNVPDIHNPALNDLIQWFTPARQIYSNSIKKFKLPFWTNSILTGTEFLAEPQVGFFHPLYFILYFIFDHFTAHLLLTFICMILCGVGAFLLAGYWGLGFYASLLTSIIYIFHPFNVTWFSYEHMLMNSATLPFLLLCYEKNLKEKTIINRHLIISLILLGLIFISGHLQIVYYTVIFFFLFVVFHFIQSLWFRKNVLKGAIGILIMFVIAILISGIVTVPFCSLLGESFRIANPEHLAKTHSLSFQEAFLNLLVPIYFHYPKWSHLTTFNPQYWILFNNYIYFGILPFIFSLISLRLIFKNKLVVFFMCVIVLAFIISTGSPLFFMIRDWLLGFKQLQHHRFIELYSYSVPFLAGFGFQVIIDKLGFLHKKLKMFLFVIIFLVITVDLMYASSFFVTWSERKDYQPIVKGGGLNFLLNEKKTTHELFRVLPFSILKNDEDGSLLFRISQPNTLQPYGIEEVSGYSSFVSKDLYNLFIYILTKNPKLLYLNEIVSIYPNNNIPFPIYNFKSKALDLLNVKYFMVPKMLTLEDKNVKKVYEGDCAIYENLGYLPRAFVVPSYKIIESKIDTIIELENEKFDPRKEVILMTSVIARSDEVTTKQSPNATRNEIASSALSEPPRNDAQFVNYQPDNITIRVNTNASGFLVLGHNLNNSWKVKINNKESKSYQANLVQRAVYLPTKGEYIVEFYYFPRLFFIGLAITLSGLFILLILFITMKNGQDLCKRSKE